MADSKEKTNVADLTLELVRHLEGSIDEVKRLIGVQGQKLDALIDLAAGTRAQKAKAGIKHVVTRRRGHWWFRS